jgi:hypothetical protein
VSERSQLEALLDPALRRDPSGRGWLAALLAATPYGIARLGELARDPGSISISLTVPGVSGRLSCFEQLSAPPRELVAWLIDHPDELTHASGTGASPEALRLRGFLLGDDPPGSRARAQERAHELLSTASPFTPQWWRFEDAAAPACVLMTERLVVTLQSEQADPLAPAGGWFPPRTRLVRDLEAARQLAHGRAFASLLVADASLPWPGRPPADEDAAITELVAAGTPHLDPAARAELAAAFLGRVGWAQAGDAVAVT